MQPQMNADEGPGREGNATPRSRRGESSFALAASTQIPRIDTDFKRRPDNCQLIIHHGDTEATEYVGWVLNPRGFSTAKPCPREGGGREPPKGQSRAETPRRRDSVGCARRTFMSINRELREPRENCLMHVIASEARQSPSFNWEPATDNCFSIRRHRPEQSRGITQISADSIINLKSQIKNREPPCLPRLNMSEYSPAIDSVVTLRKTRVPARRGPERCGEVKEAPWL